MYDVTDTSRLVLSLEWRLPGRQQRARAEHTKLEDPSAQSESLHLVAYVYPPDPSAQHRL